MRSDMEQGNGSQRSLIVYKTSRLIRASMAINGDIL